MRCLTRLEPPSMHARLATLILAACAILGSASAEEAPDKKKPAKATPADVFQMTKVWNVHLTVSEKDWQTMQPTRGGFGGFGLGRQPPAQPPKEPEPGVDREPRGGFGFDFAYVKAEIEIDGQTFK